MTRPKYHWHCNPQKRFLILRTSHSKGRNVCRMGMMEERSDLNGVNPSLHVPISLFGSISIQLVGLIILPRKQLSTQFISHPHWLHTVVLISGVLWQEQKQIHSANKDR